MEREREREREDKLMERRQTYGERSKLWRESERERVRERTNLWRDD